jgi:hypothetical protein
MSVKIFYDPFMKIKTSVSLSRETLTKIREIADADDRSVSYMIEKYAERICAQETPADPHEIRLCDNPGQCATQVKYPKPSRRNRKS